MNQNSSNPFLDFLNKIQNNEDTNSVLSFFTNPEDFQNRSEEAAQIVRCVESELFGYKIYHDFKGVINNPRGKIIVSGKSKVMVVLTESRNHEIILMNEVTAHIDGQEFSVAEILLMHEAQAYVESSNYSRIFVKVLEIGQVKTLISTVNGDGDIIVRSSNGSTSIKETGAKKLISEKK